MIDRNTLRLSAVLLAVGFILYVLVGLIHPDEPANNHRVVFAEYASSASWTAVHLGQFAGMAVIIAGLLVLYFALDVRAGGVASVARLGAVSAVVALGLYGGPILPHPAEHGRRRDTQPSGNLGDHAAGPNLLDDHRPELLGVGTGHAFLLEEDRHSHNAGPTNGDQIKRTNLRGSCHHHRLQLSPACRSRRLCSPRFNLKSALALLIHKPDR
jgi:hypothetical protein